MDVKPKNPKYITKLYKKMSLALYRVQVDVKFVLESYCVYDG